ncbi:hypothetical protein Goshw_021528 [Gossypium schwendimanii]|uniref:Uncharacterized protein n=1 Tax=Gossypium schwendimanii TaxID=34291 RepID=A0A7J9N7L6_GOSSC|nr:hypothetical protein [Gossypium schwendimanii]
MCVAPTRDCSHTKERRHFGGEMDGNSSKTSRGGRREESSLDASR